MQWGPWTDEPGAAWTAPLNTSCRHEGVWGGDRCPWGQQSEPPLGCSSWVLS